MRGAGDGVSPPSRSSFDIVGYDKRADIHEAFLSLGMCPDLLAISTKALGERVAVGYHPASRLRPEVTTMSATSTLDDSWPLLPALASALYEISGGSAPAAWARCTGPDTRLHRVVAIKVLSEVASSPRRGAVPARSPHGLVPQPSEHLHHLRRRHEPPFIAMELLEGETLQQRLRGASMSRSSSISPSPWPMPSTPPTATASSTVTSSPRTSSSDRAGPRSSTSASPRPHRPRRRGGTMQTTACRRG